MFGLPASTFGWMFGILAFWVIYTLIFFFWSGQAWKGEDRGGGRKF